MTSGFHRLLALLDPDPLGACDRFDRLRRSLVRFFDMRGASWPEDEADETIHRLAKKLESGVAVLDVEAFATGIARLVLQESKRVTGLRLVPLADDAPPVAAPSEPAEAEARSIHLDRCLDALPRGSRELLLAYYSAGEGAAKIEARLRLARERGLSPSTLRTRVQRLRERVQADLRSLRDASAVTEVRGHLPRAS